VMLSLGGEIDFNSCRCRRGYAGAGRTEDPLPAVVTAGRDAGLVGAMFQKRTATGAELSFAPGAP
jgi:hypothetical protein